MKKLRWVMMVLLASFLLQGAMSMELRAQVGSTNSDNKNAMLLTSVDVNSVDQANGQILLADLLSKLEQHYDVTFLYKDEVVMNKYVNTNEIRIGEETGQDLSFILEQLGLALQQIDEQSYVLLRKKPSFKATPMQEDISGTVTDAQSGETLPGVNITVKGTTTGTSTDSKGFFELTIESLQDTLIFSFVGYQSQEVAINGRKEIDISLQPQAISGEEMVVTALGVEREDESITYSTQNISSEDANLVKNENFMNALAGKSAGLMITSGSGGPGSESRVILRGHNSITGSNEPLYVIDGIPVDRDITNLNSGDIESIQVLKGASAASLYGSQAANGVILVSTKKGTQVQEPTINVSSTLIFSNPIALPALQTSYGQGYNGESNTAVNDSWGPKITDGSDSHLEEFFRTGVTNINSISISNGGDIGQFYGSYAYTDDKGIVPKNKLTRNNFTVNFSSSDFLNDKLTVNGSLKYNIETIYNQPGYGHGPIFSLYTFPVGDDFSKYSGDNYQIWDPQRQIYVQNWPYIRNETRPHQNPYWYQNKMQNDTEKNITRISISGEYSIYEWLSLEGRMSRDAVESDYEQRYHASTQSTISGSNGMYWRNSSSNSQTYYDIIMRSSTKYLTDNLSLSGLVGFSRNKNTNSGISLNGGLRPELLYPNYFSVSNLNGNFNRSESLTETRLDALFGNISIALFDKLWVDITGRKEWSSTVHNSYFFPSIGASYLFTEQTKGVLSYARARVSYAEVGQDLSFGIANTNPSYTVGSSGNIQPRGTLPFFSGTDTTSLRPERTKSYEIGIDLRFFKDRLDLEFNYYDATTYDQVFSIAAPTGSGAQNFWINGGEISNQGIESVLSYNTTFNDLNWISTVNFSYNRNQIRKLSDQLDAERYVLSGGRIVKLYLTRPEGGDYGSFGDLYGNRLQRDDNGNLLTNDEGIPIRNDEENTLLGNANPDFLVSISNNFNYKDISLSFLIDSRFGGGLASHTERWLDYKGLSKRTGQARDNGGVLINGNMVDAEDYYTMLSNTGDGAVQKAYFYSATNIRLRELSIGYTLHNLIYDTDVNLSLVGRNLFFFYKKAPFDPEIARNTNSSSLGLNDFEIPSTRSYGLNIEIEI